MGHHRAALQNAPLIAAGLAVALGACAAEEPTTVPAPAGGWSQAGLATWYGAALAGHKTASGEPFDPAAMTAAHRSLPLGTWVVVRLRATGREVRVRINDRGPFGDPRRVIDVSRAAADALGLTRLGVAPVDLWVVGGAAPLDGPQ